jgi:amidase
MPVEMPTPSQLRKIADEVGLHLSDGDVDSFIELMRPTIGAYAVDAMPDNLPPARYPRTPGYRPTGEQNKHNAWYVKSRIEGAAAGKLKARQLSSKTTLCWPACR